MSKFAPFVFLVAIFVAVGVQAQEHGDHNYYNCPNPSAATFNLCDVTYKEAGQVDKVLTKDIECPAQGVNASPITCIIVTDLDSDATGGYVQLESAGGVGYYEAVIQLTSQFGLGLNFRVQVYTNGTSAQSDPPISTEAF